jgi:transcriptional regulator with XRE-family HTH domain
MTEPNDDCFDGRAFFTCVDEQRRERGLSWAALGRVTHVSPPTIRRFATGEVIEADGVFALVRWLGRPLEDFSPANRHLSSGKPPLMERVEKDGVTLDQISQETGASIAQLKGFEKGGRTDIRTFLRVLRYLGADFHAYTRIHDYNISPASEK